MHTQAEQLLNDTLNTFQTLTEETFGLFYDKCKPLSFQKDEYLLQAGNTCRGVFFMIEGIVRMYELKDTKEIHKDFFFSRSFATDVQSLTSQEASANNLVALEDTQCFYISRTDLLQLYDVSPVFQGLGRNLLQHLLSAQNQMNSLYLTHSPMERYEFLLEKKPHFLQRIPLQYLASYLGMARETLSRVRKKAR